MKFDESDYFSYKKTKNQINYYSDDEKKSSKIKFMFRVFVITFIVFFIFVVVGIMKYSSRMDIEYAQGDLTYKNSEISKNDIAAYGLDPDDVQRKIDKRLRLIQQEEYAPSEAKIIEKNKNEPEVINPMHVEKPKKSKKLAEQKPQIEDKKIPLPQISLPMQKKTLTKTEATSESEDNVIIMSKVLVGRFATFEEATKMQSEIKLKNPTLTPFVKKVGQVFTVQMASYKDFSIAKAYAQELSSKGFDVWIYQQ